MIAQLRHRLSRALRAFFLTEPPHVDEHAESADPEALSIFAQWADERRRRIAAEARVVELETIAQHNRMRGAS